MTILRSTAEIALLSPAAVVARMCEHFAEHDLAAVREGDAWRIRFPVGEACIDVGQRVVEISAEARDLAGLCAIRLALASHFLEFAEPARPAIVWAGDATDVLEPPNFRRLTVLRNERLTRTMRRLSFSGPDLARYDGFDLHLKLLLSAPARPSPLWPTLGPDGLMRWPEGEDRLAVRIYTIRRIDARRGELDIDMVVHDDAIGPGSAFAATARPGDVVGMIGPGGRNADPADWHLLAGDETALPAISRILEELPVSARGIALIETADDGQQLTIRAPAGIDVRWLARDAHRQDSQSSLAEAVQGIPVPTEGSAFCWAGAEFATFRAIRAHWRSRARLDRRDHLAVSYWRRGVSQGERKAARQT